MTTYSGEGRGFKFPLSLSPDSTYTLTVTLVGLAVGSAGNWSATVVRNESDAPSTTLLTGGNAPTISVNSGTNTVTVVFSATALTSLLGSGSTKFPGHWKLRNTSTPLDLITGSFTVWRNQGASGTNSALTLTVATGSAITATITNTLPYSTLFRSLAKSLEELIVGTITRDTNGAATTASVEWPDGTTGTYTATSLSTLFPGAVDAYTVTYAGTPTVTYTQPLMTRDANGSVTVRPAMTIA